MSALIWKELRENFKWALLAMLVLGTAELGGLCMGSDADYFYNHGITLCRESFLLVTTFGPPAIGFLLGCLQIIPELNRDRWAALLHRPIPWGTLFFGKAIAGILLYLVAAGVPYLGCVWLAATPGHFAEPFVPGLMLPGIADLITGLVYYFAALLAALQYGRVAFRVLPLFAAVHLTFFVQRATDFNDAVWAAVWMTVALGIAGWGAIYSREQLRGRPWLSQLALLIVSFYGLCGLTDFARLIVRPGDDYSFTGSQYVLNDEGRPLRLNYQRGVLVSAQETDGSTPSDPKYKPDRVRNHIRYLNSASSYIGDSHGVQRFRKDSHYRSSYNYLHPGGSFPQPQPEQWFFIVEPRILVGISTPRKTIAAILDARGFQPPGATPVPFAANVEIQSMGQDSDLLVGPDNLRFADLARRTVADIPLPIPSPIYGVCSAWANDDVSTNLQITAISLRTAMAVYDNKDQHLMATLPYHRDVERWGQIEVTLNSQGDRFYLWYKPTLWISRKEREGMPDYLDEMTAQGEVVHSYTLPPLPRTPSQQTRDEYLSLRLQSPAFFFGTLLYQKVGALLGSHRLRVGLDARFAENRISQTREAATLIPIFSLVCAGITLAWARRAHFSWAQAATWAGLALALNIAGLLLFRFVADWPRVVPCAACRCPRPIERQTCPHCADHWPAPASNGTEIFDHHTHPLSS